MSGSTERADRQRGGLYALLMVVNLLFVAVATLKWSLVGVVMAPPLSWATWAPLSPTGQPEFLRYPFLLLWTLPLAGSTVAQGLKLAGQTRLAATAAAFPILLLGLMLLWYYLTPLEWH